MTDNPASRLWNILNNGKNISGNERCIDAWHKLLNVEKGNKSLLFNRLGKVITLTSIINSDVIKYHNEEIDICNKAISQINIAFEHQNLSSQWDSFMRNINEETLNYLKLISKLLNYEYKTKKIDIKELNEFRKIVDELINDIRKLDINSDFKKHLLYYLKKIIDSIDEYNILGITPIIEANEIVVGHAVIDKKFGEKLKESKLSDRFINLIEKLNILISSGNGALQLTNELTKFLPK